MSNEKLTNVMPGSRQDAEAYAESWRGRAKAVRVKIVEAE